jgi:hypothetical protein
MRYLSIAAEYNQSCLRDDFEGPIEPESLQLEADLCSALRSWNAQYRTIIPLDESQRGTAETVELIRRLDQEGKGLARRVGRTFPEAKVRYYSEGQLRWVLAV